MLPILLCLFALLDIKQVPVTDELLNEFSVMEFDNDTTADCSENPSFGGELAVPSQIKLQLEYDNPLPLGAGVNERNNVERITEGEANCDATARCPNPDPDQEPQNPIVVTPEPKSLAILSISCIA